MKNPQTPLLLKLLHYLLIGVIIVVSAQFLYLKHKTEQGLNYLLLSNKYIDKFDYKQANGYALQAYEAFKPIKEKRKGVYVLALRNLSYTYFLLDEPTKAEPLINEAISFQQSSAAVDNELLGYLYGLRATLYITNSKYEEAISDFKESALLFPSPEVYMDLGTSYICTKQFKEARLMLQKALDQSVNTTLTYSTKLKIYAKWGNLYTEEGNFAQARSSYLKALNILNSNRSSLLKEQGGNPSKIEIGLYSSMGDMYLKMKDCRNAKPLYIKVLNAIEKSKIKNKKFVINIRHNLAKCDVPH